MKVVYLTDDEGFAEVEQFYREGYEDFAEKYNPAFYNEFADDFSDVPELFSSEPKLLLVDPIAIKDHFDGFSKHLSKFSGLKYILSPYSFYAGLDLEYLTNNEIKYKNNSGANAKSVSQFATMMMLMSVSHLKLNSLNLNQNDPKPELNLEAIGEEFWSKSAGIIGMGNIGSQLAETLSGMGMEVKYHSRSKRAVPAEYVEFAEIFDCDVILVTIATNQSSIELFERLTEKLQPHNYVIDITSQSDLYDKQAVIDMVKTNSIKGYALESEEHFAPDWLEPKHNLIISPHLAWQSVEAQQRTYSSFFGTAAKILEGKAHEVEFIV